MKLCELKPAKGARTVSKRLGRGQGTGKGKTSGRGSNGQNSRSGGGTRIGFEGGQMPLMRRLPKRGFTNYRFRKNYDIVSLSDIEIKFKNKEDIKVHDFYLACLANKNAKVKVLGNGEIISAKKISAHAFSKSAKDKITKAGGKAEVV